MGLVVMDMPKDHHSPAQTAKLKYDLECLDRAIQTLDETLQNSIEKRDRMLREMQLHCDHRWEYTGKEWVPPFKSCKVSMSEMKCERCGKVSWDIYSHLKTLKES